MSTGIKGSRYQYETCCVNAVAHDINQMVDQAREVKYARARQLIDPMAWYMFKADRGYRIRGGPPGLPMSRDYTVRYFTSHYRGRRCCYIDHSCIEYIFTEGDNQ